MIYLYIKLTEIGIEEIIIHNQHNLYLYIYIYIYIYFYRCLCMYNHLRVYIYIHAYGYTLCGYSCSIIYSWINCLDIDIV